jgi:hypothetical protein
MTFENSPPSGLQQMALFPMSLPEVSRVRTSASLVMERVWTESVAAYGASSRAWFAKFDPGSYSWRTSQLSLDGDLTEFSQTLPPAGSMRNGTLYQRACLSDIAVNVSSLWPTMCARDYRSGAAPTRTALMRRLSSRGNDLPAFLRWLFPLRSGLIDPSWAEEYLGFPSGWTA